MKNRNNTNQNETKVMLENKELIFYTDCVHINEKKAFNTNIYCETKAADTKTI